MSQAELGELELSVIIPAWTLERWTSHFNWIIGFSLTLVGFIRTDTTATALESISSPAPDRCSQESRQR